MAKTLTILLNSDRDLDFCFDSIQNNLLIPLYSDLAVCGSLAGTKAPFKYAWGHDEPSDWSLTLDSWRNNDGRWRILNSISYLGNHLFSLGSQNGDIIGSGAIVLYWRDYLSEKLTSSLLAAYDWFVFTRSDFFWEVPHPALDYLDDSRIYIQNSSYYRGVPDRHFIVPSRHVSLFLSITNPIFSDPESFLRQAKVDGYTELNVEQFFLYRLKQLGLLGNVEALPQMGYLIRGRNSASRWSTGSFNPRIGAYVKYIDEYRACMFTKDFMRNHSWRSLRSPMSSKIGGTVTIVFNESHLYYYDELFWRFRSLFWELRSGGVISTLTTLFSLLISALCSTLSVRRSAKCP